VSEDARRVPQSKRVAGVRKYGRRVDAGGDNKPIERYATFGRHCGSQATLAEINRQHFERHAQAGTVRHGPIEEAPRDTNWIDVSID
jgi:hypothetical protein